MEASEHAEVGRRRTLWRLVIAVLAPFAVMSVYLFLSRWPTRWFTGSTDYAGMAGSLLVFIVCAATLPVRAGIRVATILVLVPVLYCILSVYSLMFVGVVFNDWL